MTDNHDSDSKKPREAYEPPQAIRLNGPDFAYGDCYPVGHSVVGYRTRGNGAQCLAGDTPTGICVTGKGAAGGCHAGASGYSG